MESNSKEARDKEEEKSLMSPEVKDGCVDYNLDNKVKSNPLIENGISIASNSHTLEEREEEEPEHFADGSIAAYSGFPRAG